MKEEIEILEKKSKVIHKVNIRLIQLFGKSFGSHLENHVNTVCSKMKVSKIIAF